MSTLAENAAAVKDAQVAIDAAIVAKGGTTDGGLTNAAAAIEALPSGDGPAYILVDGVKITRYEVIKEWCSVTSSSAFAGAEHIDASRILYVHSALRDNATIKSVVFGCRGGDPNTQNLLVGRHTGGCPELLRVEFPFGINCDSSDGVWDCPKLHTIVAPFCRRFHYDELNHSHVPSLANVYLHKTNFDDTIGFPWQATEPTKFYFLDGWYAKEGNAWVRHDYDGETPYPTNP